MNKGNKKRPKGWEWGWAGAGHRESLSMQKQSQSVPLHNPDSPHPQSLKDQQSIRGIATKMIRKTSDVNIAS